MIYSVNQFSSVAQSCPTLRPHELQHSRPPCPSPSPGVHSNSHPSSQWCHPAISSSVIPFSSCPQSLPASGSFPVSQLFAWGGQSIGVSALASVLPKNTQNWSPLGWTGWISLQSHVSNRDASWTGWMPGLISSDKMPSPETFAIDSGLGIPLDGSFSPHHNLKEIMFCFRYINKETNVERN